MPLSSGEVEATDFAERAGMDSGGGPIGWDHAQVCLLLRVHRACNAGCAGYIVDPGVSCGSHLGPTRRGATRANMPNYLILWLPDLGSNQGPAD